MLLLLVWCLGLIRKDGIMGKYWQWPPSIKAKEIKRATEPLETTRPEQMDFGLFDEPEEPEYRGWMDWVQECRSKQ